MSSCCTFGSEPQIIFVSLLALPPAAAPYRASGLVLWHNADVTVSLMRGRCRGKSGRCAFCPTGKSVARLIGLVSSPCCKNISVFPKPKSGLYDSHPVPLRGALRNVNDAGRDAVDADALLTNGAEADGEDVWS